MPLDFIIDVEHRVVFSAAIGILSVEDALDHMDRLRADPLYSPTFNQIGDFRDVTETTISGFDMLKLARRTTFHRDARRVAVFERPVGFGLARMFLALREQMGDRHLKITKTIAEATQWLGIDVELAERQLKTIKQRLRPPT